MTERNVNGHELETAHGNFGRHRILLNDIVVNTAWSQEHAEEIADQIENALRNLDRDEPVIDNDRRERVYEATNRILEHARATNPGGHTSEAFHKVEEQVDTILSTIGVPDRVIDE